jgi:hypothetical protein
MEALRQSLQSDEQLLLDLRPQRGFRRRIALAQMRPALHEELVEVRREDREKLHALEQRRPFIERLRKNVLIEIEPPEIPIDPDFLQWVGQSGVQRALSPIETITGAEVIVISSHVGDIVRPGRCFLYDGRISVEFHFGYIEKGVFVP